jgi:hypothetical protein
MNEFLAGGGDVVRAFARDVQLRPDRRAERAARRRRRARRLHGDDGASACRAAPESGRGALAFVELLDDVYRTGRPHNGFATPVFISHGPDAPDKHLYLDFVYQPIRSAAAGAPPLTRLVDDDAAVPQVDVIAVAVAAGRDEVVVRSLLHLHDLSAWLALQGNDGGEIGGVADFLLRERDSRLRQRAGHDENERSFESAHG